MRLPQRGRLRLGHVWQTHLRGGDGDAATSDEGDVGRRREVRRLGRAGRGAARVEGQVLHKVTLIRGRRVARREMCVCVRSFG